MHNIYWCKDHVTKDHIAYLHILVETPIKSYMQVDLIEFKHHEIEAYSVRFL